MISVTRLDGSPLLLNTDLIVTIEATPDTLVSLTTGDTVLIRETPAELVDRIFRFKATAGLAPADRDVSEATQ